MTCELCSIREKDIIYEDVDVVIAVRQRGLTPGQITVFPKEHATILEVLDDTVLKKCAAWANQISALLFDALGCEGTNILLRNGLGAGQSIAHCAFEVLPRRQADGVQVEWVGAKTDEAELDRVCDLLTSSLQSIDDPQEIVDESENYLLKSLERRP